MKTLVLPLKKKWFEMIKSGEKKEEYRVIKPFYIYRFFKVVKAIYFYTNVEVCLENILEEELEFKEFDKITFTLGYPRKDDTERRITFKNPSIRIGEGLEKWGAEKGKQYFIITWEGGDNEL